MNADEAADRLVERVRARPWGLVVAAIDGDDTAFHIDEGEDPLDVHTAFEIGSITKTLTGLLLAGCVIRNEVQLDTTVGELLGDRAGNLRDVTLLALATHRSGLPRIPPNLDASEDPTNPYAAYGVDELLAGLAATELGEAVVAYSNFGFMLLGHLLEIVTGSSYEQLARARAFEPMGVDEAWIASVPAAALRCYRGSAEARWWDFPLPGHGGASMTIAGLAAYVRAHLDEPSSTELGRAIALATTIHAGPPQPWGLGWVHLGGGWWHNGGTGGFRSFASFHPATRTGVALLANGDNAGVIDDAGFRTLTELVHSKLGGGSAAAHAG